MSGLRLDGRVAAVTGAGRGIGRAYAELLGRLGAKVVVNDLGGSTLGAGATGARPTRSWRGSGRPGARRSRTTATCPRPTAAAVGVEAAVGEFGRIDILVNNAGNMVWGALPEATIETIEAHWAVHVRGSYNTCFAAWPYLLKQNYGRVVLTTSVGIFGLPDNIGYATAKASFIGMAKSMTVGRGEANITINCIAPNAMTRLAGPPR